MSNQVQTQNTAGEWVPAIPEPIFGIKKFLFWGPIKCQCFETCCKRWFWSRDAYRGHYALVHILKLEWR